MVAISSMITSSRRVMAAAAMLSLTTSTLACTTRYVATYGDDASTGCDPNAPLRTIGACIASDTQCLLLPGTYREPTTLVTGLVNLTIASASADIRHSSNESEAVLDGTVELSGWEERADQHGAYYRSSVPYNGTVWQLWIEGAPLTVARWPNADAWSDEAWSRGTGWAEGRKGHLCSGRAPQASLHTMPLLAPGCSPSSRKAMKPIGSLPGVISWL